MTTLPPIADVVRADAFAAQIVSVPELLRALDAGHREARAVECDTLRMTLEIGSLYATSPAAKAALHRLYDATPIVAPPN